VHGFAAAAVAVRSPVELVEICSSAEPATALGVAVNGPVRRVIDAGNEKPVRVLLEKTARSIVCPTVLLTLGATMALALVVARPELAATGLEALTRS
jgi:hypothetical protein